MIVQTSDVYNISPQPTDVFDFYANKAMSTGLYTPEEYFKTESRANDWFLNKFNIDTNRNTTYPLLPVPGVAMLLTPMGMPFALTFPYGVGLSGNLKIAIDTDDCQAAKRGDKYLLSFGRFIQFIAAGNLTTSVGLQNYQPGDFIFSIDGWLVKQSTNITQKERLILETVYVNKGITNSQYKIVQYSDIRVRTKALGVGRGALMIMSNLVTNYTAGIPQPINQLHRATYTWDNEFTADPDVADFD